MAAAKSSATEASAKEPGFVHLHVHSSYSLLEGALTIARLAELAKKDRKPALALTDTDNMFGALEFSEKMAGAGIQPIVGCALGVDFGDQDNRGPAAGESFPRIVLLAAREEGYRSLLRLTSRAYLETAQSERPHLKLAWLAEETPGLIVLSGGPGGPLDTAIAAGQGALAAARCETLHRLYGDRLYIELQRHGMAAERLCEPALIELTNEELRHEVAERLRVEEELRRSEELFRTIFETATDTFPSRTAV